MTATSTPFPVRFCDNILPGAKQAAELPVISAKNNLLGFSTYSICSVCARLSMADSGTVRMAYPAISSSTTIPLSASSCRLPWYFTMTSQVFSSISYPTFNSRDRSRSMKGVSSARFKRFSFFCESICLHFRAAWRTSHNREVFRTYRYYSFITIILCIAVFMVIFNHKFPIFSSYFLWLHSTNMLK